MKTKQKETDDLLDEFDEIQIAMIELYVDQRIAKERQESAAWLKACSEARDALKEIGIYHRPVSNTWALRVDPPDDNIEFQTPVAAANHVAAQLAFLRARSVEV